MNPSEYCRQIESHLCRKNGGHLVRIVGPAFEKVCGWAEQGIPLKIAFRGIDQHCERSYAKGPRRRPVRIESCEADILDLFDSWRRAVGLWSVVPPAERAERPRNEVPDAAPTRHRQGLQAHVDRVLVRLTSLLAAATLPNDLRSVVERIAGELDESRGRLKNQRGAARVHALERLGALDTELADVARRSADPALLADLAREAELELAPFVGRMAAEARARSLQLATARLLRERLGFPRIALD